MILIIPKGTKIITGDVIPKASHVSWLEHIELAIKLVKDKKKKNIGMLMELEDLESLRDFIKEFQK